MGSERHDLFFGRHCLLDLGDVFGERREFVVRRRGGLCYQLCDRVERRLLCCHMAESIPQSLRCAVSARKLEIVRTDIGRGAVHRFWERARWLAALLSRGGCGCWGDSISRGSESPSPAAVGMIEGAAGHWSWSRSSAVVLKVHCQKLRPLSPRAEVA
jgi:hypothetical protein